MELSENARRIINATNKPGIIAGIHNYCDRWCEKCSFTERCSSFSIEKEFAKDELKTEDELWTHLSVMLETSLELLKSQSEELGIELDNPEIDIDHNFDNKLSGKNNPIICEASYYSKSAQAWLDSNENVLQNLDTLLFEKGPEKLFIEEIHDPSFTDLIEVISYYKDFIPVKLNRALMQNLEKTTALKELAANDANGSAKIALISIDRSIGAWASILKRMPSREDDLLSLLVVLQKLRCAIETEFPEARKFHRPGFDD